MTERTRIAVVGLGNRGYYMIRDVLLAFEDVDVTAVCDVYPDRNERVAQLVKEKKGFIPFTTTDYRELLARDDIDAVYVSCSWEYHIEIAIASMKAGKPVGVEVGGAYSVEELHEMVRVREETNVPLMLMENCCYNKEELLATAVARSGKLGEIVHCMGAYAHDLRHEIAYGNINRHYRLRNYRYRNAENYPTHELGPIAKLLDINRGNRMVSLVSVASKAAGMEQYISDHPELTEKDPTLINARFKQGDIVHTIITCQNGETILLKLDTTLPRSYSREFTVRGTKGSYYMDSNSFYIDGMKEFWTPVDGIKNTLDNAKDYEEEFLPTVWKNMSEESKKYGHGGMDAVMFRDFIECLREGKEMPIDVYDAAAWMCITALSEQSIAQGGAPQSIPDFTNGKWLLRPRKDVLAD
ncbi:MAG: Gfo/Idh/MocA family oxidoreductase [Clostridia bacterium]|nr:Gfo/Idh/MocA family oxidoreductase [Clostridia bacterium]